jgi:hypothetical protein
MTGIAAILSIIMLIAGIATWSNPQFNGSLDDITGYFVKRAALAQVSVDLNLLGAIPSLVFAAGLFMLLRERGETVLGLFSFGCAIMVGVVSTIFMASNEALMAFAGQASESEIRLLMALDNAVDNMLFFPVGLWVGASSLGLVRGHLFARWVGWAGVLAALLMLLSDMVPMTSNLFIGMLGLLLFAIWSIAIGVGLLRRPIPVSEQARTDTVFAGA